MMARSEGLVVHEERRVPACRILSEEVTRATVCLSQHGQQSEGCC